jgi:hypothetical protein
MTDTMAATLPMRFWSKVDKSGECWLWTASLTPYGYGQIVVTKGKPRHAHRIALELSGVEIPKGAHVHHRCEVRACVNPAHLEIVSGQHEHSQRHLRGCHRHGETDMRVIRSGRNVGVRYCGECNREKARRVYAAKRAAR